MHRSENIQKLQSETFDLCIIGGGASGAGCALDAALRGLKVALVEKTDFSAGTSSKSTKMIHGGVRYLEQAFKNLDFAQLRQVRHGLEERHILLHNAPHLTRRIGLITPVFSWWSGLYYYLGLCLYDVFAARKDNLPASRWLSKKETLELMPGITPNIHSAVLYYDGQLDDARYCLALVQSAAAAGAVVANHLEVLDFQKDSKGKIVSATAKDSSTPEQISPFSINAKQYLNCCGPYADQIRELANPKLLARISPSKGVHLMLPLRYFNSQFAMLIPKTKDGRVVFAIPFEGRLLLGTTDEPNRDLENEPVLEGAEVDFLIETLQPFVLEKIKKTDVKAGFGGLRPLVAARRKKARNQNATKTLLRDHEVEFDKRSGLISLLGGKWTTYRIMAKDTIDFVCKRLGSKASSSTGTHLLSGAALWEIDLWKKIVEKYPLDKAISQHLAFKYGSNAIRIAEMTVQNPDLGTRILKDYPFIGAEVLYAVQEEMALEIRDFMARRIRLELLDWKGTKAAAPVVAKLMGSALGWSETEENEKAAAYIRLIADFENHAK